MAAFNGTAAVAAAVLPGTMSALLSGASLPAPTSNAWRAAPAIAVGTRTAGAPAAIAQARTGVRAPGHDAQWFERIHVVPRRYDLAFLLSEQTVPVEVWNAYRAASRVLTAITVTGSAGLQVDSPPALPLVVPATRSTTYTIRALTTGDPVISNLVTWVFTGIASSGTDLTLSGSRLVPFPFPPNMIAGIEERRGYLTDVIEAFDISEQRVQLRAAPIRGVAYELLAADPREAQYASALVHGWLDGLFGVPLWQYARRLATAAPIGTDSLLVSTNEVPWSDGDMVFLWASPFTWETATALFVNPGSLDLTAGVQKAWPAGTIVVPLAIGRLRPEQDLDWPTLRAVSGRFDFALEPGLEPPAPAPGTTYQGFDVLTAAGHNRRGRLVDSIARAVEVLDPGTGLRAGDTRAAAPNPVRPFLWTCFTQVQITALRDFVDARKGRAVPFWVLSHNQDLQLAADASSGATTLTVHWVGYTQRLFTLGGSRRHLALYAPGSAPIYRKVTAASDPGTGLTETLTLDSPLAAALPAATTVLSFLRLCRLEDDAVTTRWITNDKAEAELRFRELPQEAPA